MPGRPSGAARRAVGRDCAGGIPGAAASAVVETVIRRIGCAADTTPITRRSAATTGRALIPFARSTTAISLKPASSDAATTRLLISSATVLIRGLPGPVRPLLRAWAAPAPGASGERPDADAVRHG